MHKMQEIIAPVTYQQSYAMTREKVLPCIIIYKTENEVLDFLCYYHAVRNILFVITELIAYVSVLYTTCLQYACMKGTVSLLND